MNAPREIVVLAGGFGTRLRSMVSDVPKPMALVAGRPFLAWILEEAREQGILRAVLATGYLGECVEAYFGTNWRGLEIEYSREIAPLGTGGAIKLALERLTSDAFFVVNGDSFSKCPLSDLADITVAKGADIGVGLVEVKDVGRYGAAQIQDGLFTGFTEKGSSGPGLINAGWYLVNRSSISQLPSGNVSFERDVLAKAAANGSAAALPFRGGFIDIGVPEDYIKAQSMFDPAHA